MAAQGKVTAGIVRYLRKNIQDGAWKPGERIPSENELCAALGVSRVSVRSALSQMSTLGILRSVHGKGTFLLTDDLSVFGEPRPRSAGEAEDALLSEMRQILEFRLFLEPAVSAEAARRADPVMTRRLTELLERMRGAIGKSREFVAADMEFHLEIGKSVGNPILSKTLTELLGQRTDAHTRLNRAVGYYGGIYYHGLILDALKKRDPKRAGALMTEHLQHSLEELSADGEPSA